MKYKGLVISDIHVGAMPLDIIRREYNEIFINKINNMKKLDFVIVAGDFFDHKFYLNDKESIVAYSMLNDLVEACKEKNAALRFVYGTESHECNQYDILSLLKIYDNVKVIKYAESEELLDGLNVLYLPEEHLLNKSEYYKDLFIKDTYNYVFGHGVIREVTTDIAVTIENRASANKKRKEVPVFSTKELTNICKGQTFFGHYHINKEIDNKVFSIGSFSRWKFGEEERKGFYELTCDSDKDTYEAKYIENTSADPYTTVTYGYNNDIFNNETDMNETLLGIENMINRDLHNHVRFVFNVPENVENPEATLNLIKERYKFNDNIKTEVVHGYVEKKKEKQKEQIRADNLKYSFIFDENLSIEEKTSRYIEIEYNKVIDSNKINKYLTLTLQELIDENNEIEQ